MRNTRTSSSRCIKDNKGPGTYGWRATATVVFVFSLATASCSRGSYAERGERHLGTVTTAAIECLRTLENKGDLARALDHYGNEIRQTEDFLRDQSAHAQQPSYQKLAELLARHKELLATLQHHSGGAKTPRIGNDTETAPAAAAWVQEINGLLRDTSEVRSLLRQGN